MSDLPQTQEVGDVSMIDSNTQMVTQPWGILFPLRTKMPFVEMTKDSYTVGRDASCDVVLTAGMFVPATHFNTISKVHFKIEKEATDAGSQVFIHDLSTNGTFLNGKKIGKGQKHIVSNDDEISMSTQSCKGFMFTSKLSSDYPVEVSSKYTVYRSLGKGACGEVRVAIRKGQATQYAMKIIPKSAFPPVKRTGQYELNEVKILKKLDYPCTVKVHDVIDTKDTLFIVLELVEGGELFDRILKNEYLSEEDTKFFFIQMLMATKYLHDSGITHRDLKPENILLSGHSNRCLIKLTDFGLSKIVSESTMLRTFCGTPTYLAPEVLLTAGNGSYTPSIDIWSLGVILYVCLVGYPPFTDERKDYDLKTQIIYGKYDFPERFWSHVSAPAKDLVRRLLCVKPEDRITLEEALLHPWLDDKNLRAELADLVKTAGYPELVEGIMDPRTLISSVKQGANLNGGEGNDTCDTIPEIGNNFIQQKRSIVEEGEPTTTTNGETMVPPMKRPAF